MLTIKNTTLPLMLAACINILSAQDIKILDLRINDIAYVPAENRIYCSSPGDYAGGNTLLVVNPLTGVVEQRYPVGSEPRRLALSGDGQYLYVALDGAPYIRRFNLLTHTVDQNLYYELVTVPDDGHFPRTVHDMEVLPGQPQSLLVSRRDAETISDFAGIFVYDNTTPRPDSIPVWPYGSKHLEIDETGTFAYGVGHDYLSGGLYRYKIDANGVTLSGEYPSLLPNPIKNIEIKGDRLYSTNRDVISLAGPEPVKTGVLDPGGNFDVSMGTAICPASDSAVIYGVNSRFDFSGIYAYLHTFDENTLQLGSELPLPGVPGTPLKLIEWGGGGRLAMLNEFTEYHPATGYVTRTRLIILRNCPPVAPVNLSLSPTLVTACTGDTVEIQATSPGYVNYIWSNGATGATVRVPAGQVNDLSYKAVTANGCLTNVSETAFIIAKNPPGTASIFASPVTSVLCPDASITLQAFNSEAEYFIWNTGDTTDLITVAAPGYYTVESYTTPGCHTGQPAAIEIKPANGALPPKPVITIAGDLEFCSGQSALLSAPAGYDFYEWTTGEFTPAIEVFFTGNYAVRLRNANGCAGEWSDAVAIQVNQTPGQPFFNVSDTALLSNWASGNQWFFNGQPIPGATVQVLTLADPGFYSLQVTQDGCSSPMSVLYNFQIVGTHEAQALRALAFFPNPTTGKVQFEWPERQAPVVRGITDALGRNAGHWDIARLSGNNWQLDLTNLPAGWYFIKMTSADSGVQYGMKVLRM